MKVWLAFLLLSFVLGGRAVRQGRSQHVWYTLAACVAVAVMVTSPRWI